MRFSFNPEQVSGSRIIKNSVEINDEPLEKDKVCVLLWNDSFPSASTHRQINLLLINVTQTSWQLVFYTELNGPQTEFRFTVTFCLIILYSFCLSTLMEMMYIVPKPWVYPPTSSIRNLPPDLWLFFLSEIQSLYKVLSLKGKRWLSGLYKGHSSGKKNTSFVLSFRVRVRQAFSQAAVQPSFGRPVLRIGRFSTACFGRPFTN